jgi:uncharacterized protein (DUF1697 family)
MFGQYSEDTPKAGIIKASPCEVPPVARLVVFLRAINVGGHTVAMSRLVELFEALECEEVSTFIASGNVVLSSRTRPALLEQQIDRHLEAELGFPAEAFVRTLPALAGVLAQEHFTASEVSRAHALMVGFVRKPPAPSVARQVEALSGPTDRLRCDGTELYWLRTARDSDPKLSSRLEKAMGQPMTVRNSNTVRRIVERYAR